ncbi:MAG: glycosyltransferase [Spirochaetota bacterium]
MRVLLVSHFFPPVSYSGTEIYTYNLALALIKLGHEVYVVNRSHSDKYNNYTIQIKSYDDIPIIYINKYLYKESFKKTYFDEQIDKLFTRIIYAVNPDLVHINHLSFLSMGIVDVIKKLNLPIVMTLHDYWLICPQFHLHKNFKLCYSKNEIDCSICIENQHYPKDVDLIKERNLIAAEILSKIDVLISPSEFLKNKYVEFFNIDPESILHIKNGISVYFQANRNVIQQKSINKTILGFFGNIIWTKGLHVLLEAFDKLDKWKYDLCIYGKLEASYGVFLDDKYPWWRKYYHGEYKNFESINLMAGSIDILIFPSIIYENYPTVVNESLCAGIPVICVNNGGAPELIQENLTGYFFNNLDVEDLINKIKLLDQNTLNNIKPNLLNFKPYSFDEHAIKINELYSTYNTLVSKKNDMLIYNSVNTLLRLLDYTESNSFVSTLFLDMGNGFNGNELIQQILVVAENDKISVNFNLKNFKNIQRVRFDPLENQFCKLKINRVIVENLEDNKELIFSEFLDKISFNGKLLKNGLINFETLDPQVVLPISGEIQQLTIDGELQLFDISTRATDLISQKDKEISQKDELLKQKENEAKGKEDIINGILNSRTWRWGNKIDVFTRKLMPKNGFARTIVSIGKFLLIELGRWLTSPKFQLKRYFRWMAREARLIYHIIPFSDKMRNIHKLFLTKYAPSILRAANINPLIVRSHFIHKDNKSNLFGKRNK